MVSVKGAGPGAQRGLALVVVLWVLVLLSLIAASFTRTTRTEVNLASNLIDNAKAEALADAGVYRAIYAVLSNESEPVFGEELEELLRRRPEIEAALRKRPEVQDMLRDRAAEQAEREKKRLGPLN